MAKQNFIKKDVIEIFKKDSIHIFLLNSDLKGNNSEKHESIYWETK
jgi:hypothetical protein